MSKVSLDEIDVKLLQILKRDSRLPFSAIAKELKLSESAVRKRTNRLIKLGVIKRFTIDYATPTDIKATILVKVSPPTPVPEAAQKILEIKFVDAVYEVTGETDILAFVQASSIDEINYVIDQIRNVPGVVGTNTLIVLKEWVKTS